MATPFSIDRSTGGIRIGGEIFIEALQTKSLIEPHFSHLLSGSRDHRNGYEWLYLSGLTFGGRPAGLSICFHDGRLVEAGWNVDLPNAETEGNWPTQNAIDAEIAFVRSTLKRDMEIQIGIMPWGEIWSSFDAKGFMAANGLRYSKR